MQTGNSFVAGLAYYPGSPVSNFDCIPGTLVIDYSTPALWLKTSLLGDSSGYVLIPSGTAAGAITIAGALTLSAAFIGSVQALSGAGAVNVTTLTTKFTSTGSAQALTLADGTNGQIKIIVHAVDGGSGVLTPTTKTGFSTLTFTAAGDSAMIQFFTTQGWMLVGTPTATAA